MVSGVIFDVGAHTGEDTDFYLGKGFRVVAVEANPALAKGLRRRFKRAVSQGNLIVVEKAVSAPGINKVPFYINQSKDDWSSTFENVASKGSSRVREILVDAVSLPELFREYGVPHYLKIDIEMGDVVALESLLGTESRPRYISAEIHEIRVLETLATLGYRKFQILNQWLNGFVQPVSPAREGRFFWPGQLGGYHSGLFGAELPEEDWVGFETARDLYLAHMTISRYGLAKNSWFDIHAKMED